MSSLDSGARLGYTVMMSLLYMTFPGIYSIVAAAVNEAFGPDYYKVWKLVSSLKHLCRGLRYLIRK